MVLESLVFFFSMGTYTPAETTLLLHVLGQIEKVRFKGCSVNESDSVGVEKKSM